MGRLGGRGARGMWTGIGVVGVSFCLIKLCEAVLRVVEGCRGCWDCVCAQWCVQRPLDTYGHKTMPNGHKMMLHVHLMLP